MEPRNVLINALTQDAMTDIGSNTAPFVEACLRDGFRGFCYFTDSELVDSAFQRRLTHGESYTSEVDRAATILTFEDFSTRNVGIVEVIPQQEAPDLEANDQSLKAAYPVFIDDDPEDDFFADMVIKLFLSCVRISEPHKFQFRVLTADGYKEQFQKHPIDWDVDGEVGKPIPA